MIREARVDGRKRRGRMTREITYQKVLLAVYMLADEEGFCRASDREIGRECGVSAPSVRQVLAEMERRDVVYVYDQSMGFRGRSLGIADHPSFADPFEGR